ncbi:hypothetical protein [Streptomyces collinus]|uniref:hypothetical protein n=1 Tax=Streptomyces collinus TaxID=42684 RepID=UPI003B20DA6E
MTHVDHFTRTAPKAASRSPSTPPQSCSPSALTQNCAIRPGTRPLDVAEEYDHQPAIKLLTPHIGRR